MVTIAVGLSGCVIPYRFTTRQGAVGSIVDKGSHRPLSGALITVTTHGETISANSGTNGRFIVPSVREWGVFLAPTDPRPTPWVLKVSAPDYQTYTEKYWTTYLDEGSRDLGYIELTK